MATDCWQRQITYARLSLTETCNFACPYCRPNQIAGSCLRAPKLSVNDWMILAEALHLLGIKALRLTGGEPTLYPHLKDLVQSLTASHWFEDISMTTNGSTLKEGVSDFYAWGINRLNISLDAVTETAFTQATGRKGQLANVICGIEEALKQPFSIIKINTVLSHYPTDQEVNQLLSYIEKWPVIWRFIEYMPLSTSKIKGPNFTEWTSQLERLTGGSLRPVKQIYGHGPASYYRLTNGTTIGFIFPMSHSYCSHCNRIRFTADGNLKLCLLHNEEIDLRTAIQSGASPQTIANRIQTALLQRHESHQEASNIRSDRPMWRIGG